MFLKRSILYFEVRTIKTCYGNLRRALKCELLLIAVPSRCALKLRGVLLAWNSEVYYWCGNLRFTSKRELLLRCYYWWGVQTFFVFHNRATVSWGLILPGGAKVSVYHSHPGRAIQVTRWELLYFTEMPYLITLRLTKFND